MEELKFETIINGLKNGSITIDFAGHNNDIENARFREELIERAQSYIDFSHKMLHETEHTIFSIFLNEPIKLGEAIDKLCQASKFYCFKCGRQASYVLKDARTLTIGLSYGQEGQKDTNNVCPISDTTKSFSYEITVNSGKLVFVNYFDDRKKDKNGEEIEILEPKNKYSEEFSLNSLQGRINITKHYAKQNIAYGQMGNMTIGIFKNKTGDKIIIGDPARKKIKGLSLVDSISLGMWRWMAADQALIKKLKIKPRGGIVTLDVPNGTYKVTNYFDFFEDEYESPIYSTLEKIT